MSNLYIITDPDKIQVNLYKIGSWSGTFKDLLRRYVTYFPQVIVVLFYPIENARYIENQVKNRFIEDRQINIFGRRSEWIKGNINDIVSFISFICEKLNEIKINRANDMRRANVRVKLNDLAAWSDAPITVTDDEIKNTKHNIENGIATVEEQISYQKSSMIKSLQVTDNITIEQLYENRDYTFQMDNLDCELNFNDRQILQLDLNRVKNAEKINQVRIGRIKVIKDLCSLLGLKNTFDKTVEIPRQRIECIVPYLKEHHPRFKSLFSIRSNGILDRYMGVIGLINSIFTEWSRCKLVNIASKTDTNNGLQRYKLCNTPESFYNVFLARNPLKSPNIRILNLAQVNIQNPPRVMTLNIIKQPDDTPSKEAASVTDVFNKKPQDHI